MAIRVLKEVDRLEGFPIETGATIIAGQPVKLTSAGKILPFDAAAGEAAIGFADVHTQPLPIAPVGGGPTVGLGYDYTDFARGGLVGAYIDGGVFEMYDDGRGAPYVTTDTYVVNKPVYANAAGKVTSVSTDNFLVGYCMAFTGAPVTLLKIKSVL